MKDPSFFIRTASALDIVLDSPFQGFDEYAAVTIMTIPSDGCKTGMAFIQADRFPIVSILEMTPFSSFS